jgi:DNA-directed RNA polymerase subunit RPC12/RpoP
VSPLAHDEAAKSTHACPNCGSEMVKKLSLVHAAGLSDLTAETAAGAVFGGREPGVGVAMTKGTQQTVLSKSAAPPAKRKGLAWGVILVVVSLVAFSGSSIGFGALCLLAGGWLAYSSVRYNSDVFPGLLAEWQRKYLCERCGTVFVGP